MRTRVLISIGALIVVLAAAGATSAGNPAGFTARVDNPWFPLRPGTTFVYKGVKDGQPSRDVLTVTRRTAVIGGAPCVVLEDRLYLRGHLGERPTDGYTQDKAGNVWYYGEATAELDAKGHVTGTKGSWRAGVNGAKPGIYMSAHPSVGQSFRQEYYKGQAEDHFQVVSLAAPVHVPYVSSRRALVVGAGRLLDAVDRGVARRRLALGALRVVFRPRLVALLDVVRVGRRVLARTRVPGAGDRPRRRLDDVDLGRSLRVGPRRRLAARGQSDPDGGGADGQREDEADETPPFHRLLPPWVVSPSTVGGRGEATVSSR